MKRNVNKTKQNRNLLLVIVCLLLVLNVVLIRSAYTKQSLIKKEEITQEEPVKTGKKSSFDFVGVGDNLIHGAIWYHQKNAGQGYDFKDIYEYTNPYTQNADLAFINGETICAPGFELSHYPVFNGPVEILDAVNAAGFDWMALSSNHSMDMGYDGLVAEMNYLKENASSIVTTGSHATKEEAEQYIVKEVNGLKVGLLGYTYGLNGYSLPEDKPWLVDLIDKEKIKKDMEAISKISDVQLVSMHWGVEYDPTITEEQRDLADYLHALGAEAIIGHHPHVIGPVELLRSKDQETLVYYSLGNFLSAQDTSEGMVGGMANFTLNYDHDRKKASFTKAQFIPTITYFDPNFYTFKTTTIHEYTQDMADTHFMTANGLNISKEWVQQYVQEVVGSPERIEVVLN